MYGFSVSPRFLVVAGLHFYFLSGRLTCKPISGRVTLTFLPLHMFEKAHNLYIAAMFIFS